MPRREPARRRSPARHHVYVIELSREVLKHPKFRRANPHHDPAKPCLYVGMTGLDPETRFDRHRYGVKDNPYVHRYGLRLRPDLYAGLNPLPYVTAQRMERVLAGELRADGYAVWQH
jgi:hypothetical protein